MRLLDKGPWLARRAEATPDAVALRFEGATLTWAELDGAARRVARALARAGVSPDDRVAVAAAPSDTALALLHALAVVGAIAVPLNLRLTGHELEHPLRDSGARWLVADADAGAPARAAATRVGTAVLELDALQGGGADRFDHAFDAFESDRPMAILYTSGTSGRPKGAVLSYANFRASAEASARLLGARPCDGWLACMPLFHVGGLSIATRSVLAGVPVLLHDRFDAERVARDLDLEAVTLVSMVSTMLARVLDARGDAPPPPALRAVLLGGGPTPPALLERARAAGIPVAPTYGLTEAASQVATRPPVECRPPLDGRLRPLPGSEVRVVDGEGRPLPPGSVGEVCVRGPTVMKGYWERPEATARALRDGWLFTGDLGQLDAEGGLAIVDRRSDLVVSGGENVYPAEVEAVLACHPDVVEAAVAGVPDPVFGRRPAAWVVMRPGAPLADMDEAALGAALGAFCAARLARFKVPVRFTRRAALPRTATGKLLRRELAGD